MESNCFVSNADSHFLKLAVDEAASFRMNENHTPFGAVVVVNDKLVARSSSRVVELCDPSAHAEVLAIRQACLALGSHLLPNATLYCSSFPCPLCLSAARWAQIPRIVYAGSLEDSSAVGFEDRQFYNELESGLQSMDLELLRGNESLRRDVQEVLQEWKRGWPPS